MRERDFLGLLNLSAHFVQKGFSVFKTCMDKLIVVIRLSGHEV